MDNGWYGCGVIHDFDRVDRYTAVQSSRMSVPREF